MLLNYGQITREIQDLDELILRVEEWLNSIDVRGHSQGEFAKSLLGYLLAQNMIPTKRPKEVQIIKDFLISRKGRSWLSNEERVLKRLYTGKKVSVDYIARELGRSKQAIYGKAGKLGYKRPKNAMTRARWIAQQAKEVK